MSTRSIAIIREEAKGILKHRVSSRATLCDALPVLVELAEAVKAAKHIYDVAREVLGDLSDACADYALAHDSVFDDGLATNAKGIKSGDITIDKVVYHLASGYDTPVRRDGEPLTQSFLSSLPKDWAKASWKIDTTGINRLGISDSDLAAQGLFRPAKNTWSSADAIA